MDAIAYSHSAKQAKRIKKFINEPDSSSGVVTVPKVIASGETITIPAGRMAVLPNIQIDGTLNVQGDVFIPSGATMSKVVEKVTSTDNAVVRFNGTTGDVQNSGVIIDDNNNIGVGTSTPNKGSWGKAVTIESTTNEAYELVTNGVYMASLGAGGSTVNLSTYGSIPLLFGTNGSERMRIDSVGNVGIGVTPIGTGLGKVIEIGNTGNGLWNAGVNNTSVIANAYWNGSNYVYANNGIASQYQQNGGTHFWRSAISGTTGNVITFTNTMTLDANGNLLVGTLSGSTNTITKNVATGSNVLNIVGNTYGTYLCAADATGYNNTNTTIFVGKISTTNRSINAAGTINASGADYAEYEYSNDLSLVKGQIVGFKADGTLTDKYSEAIRFAIKSTNPSIVGGDTWGIEEIIGKRPEQPVKSEEMTDEEFAELEELYELELADFEVRLEAERQKVDRIAYAGKVPVNVYGAVAGQYVIAVEKDGGIDGKLVNKSDMTFAEYQDAVGRVNKILDDGRAEVAVIIH